MATVKNDEHLWYRWAREALAVARTYHRGSEKRAQYIQDAFDFRAVARKKRAANKRSRQ